MKETFKYVREASDIEIKLNDLLNSKMRTPNKSKLIQKIFPINNLATIQELNRDNTTG